MAISKRIIHCLVDREPTAFHASDADGTKASYAVNLSFEVQSNGAAADAAQDALDAKDAFENFLQAVRDVRFQLYKVKDRIRPTSSLTMIRKFPTAFRSRVHPRIRTPFTRGSMRERKQADEHNIDYGR